MQREKGGVDFIDSYTMLAPVGALIHHALPAEPMIRAYEEASTDAA
jgi:hypothetical protein